MLDGRERRLGSLAIFAAIRRALAGCTPTARKRKAGSIALLPASLAMTSTRKAVRQSQITVRLWTDSVNPLRYKSLQRCAKATDSKAAGRRHRRLCLSPYDVGLGLTLFGGAEREALPNPSPTQTAYALARSLSRPVSEAYTAKPPGNWPKPAALP